MSTDSTSTATTRTDRQPATSDRFVAPAKLDWFHQLLECDLRVCNNCLAARVPEADSVRECYDYFRTPGCSDTGSPRGDQNADVWCQHCGAGIGTDDLVILEVSQPDPVIYDQDSPSKEWVRTPAPRYYRETTAHARPGDDADAGWREQTNLTQPAAGEARGSAGRSWSRSAPMPLRGETPSLVRCVRNASDQLEARHGITVDAEAATDDAVRWKQSDYPDDDRQILARVLADHADQSAAAIRATARGDQDHVGAGR